MSIFPTTILLATDGSAGANLACQTAVNISEKTGSELHVIYAWLLPRISPYYDLISSSYRFETEGDAHQRAQERLQNQVACINKLGSEASPHLEMVEPDVGGPDAKILALAEDIGTGLIVLGSRGWGRIRRALLGSVSDSVVRHAHCPVLVVRALPIVFPTKIVVATDGSREADLASSSAADLANRTGSELHFVCVGHMPPVYYESPGAWALDRDLRSRMEERVEAQARTKLDEEVQRVREAGGEVAGAHARLGRPDAEIVRFAEEKLRAGLIVLGSRGLRPLRSALMGSVSTSVVRHAHCPVLVVRAEEEQAG